MLTRMRAPEPRLVVGLLGVGVTCYVDRCLEVAGALRSVSLHPWTPPSFPARVAPAEVLTRGERGHLLREPSEGKLETRGLSGRFLEQACEARL